MKRAICLLLVAVMAVSLGACSMRNNETTPTDTNPTGTNPTETTGNQTQTQNGALQILEKIWNSYPEQERFPVIGGDADTMVENGPGNYGLQDTATLNVQLLVPENEAKNITEAAAMFHGMMVNNFSCGVFKVANGVSTGAFADTMQEAVEQARWMCGTPEKELIAVIGDEYVLMAFGLQSVLDTFRAKLIEAYPDAQIKYEQLIAR